MAANTIQEIEEEMEEIRMLMKLWNKFYGVLTIAFEGTADDCRAADADFQQVKTVVAEHHDHFMKVIKKDKHIGQSILTTVKRTITLEGFNHLSRVESNKTLIDWHDANILLNETIGSLECDKDRIIRKRQISFEESKGKKILRILTGPLVRKVVPLLILGGIVVFCALNWEMISSNEYYVKYAQPAIDKVSGLLGLGGGGEAAEGGSVSGRLDACAPWLTLLRVKGLAGGRLRRLIAALGSPEAILAAPVSQLSQISGISLALAEGIREAASGCFKRQVKMDLRWLENHQAHCLPFVDPKYPEPLREIHSPPSLLYVQGKLLRDEPCIAIVGSRGASDHGKRLAGRLAEDLARAGFTIVSGLAHGIDGAAHKGALRARGRTIAVMGCGLQTIYPREHTDLSRQVIKSGALITELPLATSPQRNNFVPRNRIIAGLSWATVVVEAAMQSGALSTARFAQEENREVFAIPGRPNDPVSEGANSLIKEQGAQLVTDASDILEALKERMDIRDKMVASATEPSLSRTPDRTISHDLDGQEALVYDKLGSEPLHIDDLSRSVEIEVGRLSSILGLLELRGLIERQAGARFRRA